MMVNGSFTMGLAQQKCEEIVLEGVGNLFIMHKLLLCLVVLLSITIGIVFLIWWGKMKK